MARLIKSNIVSNKTNIILTNLSSSKLKMVLELCDDNFIDYTFDKNYYSEEYYNFYKIYTLNKI